MGSGLGFTIGKREQSGNGTASGTTAVGSTVGAIDGNVTIVAGNQYTQTGSDVIAPGGDVSIRARSVAITEARETSRSQSEQHASQSGLSVGLSSPTLSAAQGALGTARAMGNTSDGRMQALGAATLALQGNQLANSLNTAQTPGGNAADQAGGINLNISLGSSRSDSRSSSQSDTARGSTVQAGGNVSIVATGGGQDSNILIQGSDITAGNRASLYADNHITLRAADNTSSQDSSNSASSGSIGLGNAGGVSLNASGSRAGGSGNGSDQWASNTHITGGNRVDIHSGGNTALDGAVVAGNRVTADIRGDLLIGSRQDTSTYTSQQSSSGASLSVSPTGVPTGGSLSSGRSNLDGSYRSVGETSGIKAGDAGFDVNVQGLTTLNGGVITSTDTAVNEGRNGFAPQGGVTVTDLTNTASFSGSGYSVTLSGGTGPDGKGGEIFSPGGSAGVGSTGGNASSVTTGGVSGFVGDTSVRTGDAPTGIAPIFDAAQQQREVDAQVQITAVFGQQASSAWGSYADRKLAEASANSDPEQTQCWSEGGACRVAGHTIIGGLAGGVSGALGAGISQATIDVIGQQIANTELPPEIKQALVAISGSLAGAVAGGASGAAAAFNATANNYLSAADLRSKEQKLNACRAANDGACEIKVLKEYESRSATNSGNILYTSVLSESDLQRKKADLEQLLTDPSVSTATKAEARKSIGELEVAINVIQKSPVLQDAAAFGLIAVDVMTLGELAITKALTSAFLKEFIFSRTGKEITTDSATTITNNFYREGTNPPNWSPGKFDDISINAADHWSRHGSEFSDLNSMQEYVSNANQFVNNPPAGTQYFSRPNGDKIFYDAASNTFAVQASSGMPRTMFKPKDGDLYWLKQVGLMK